MSLPEESARYGNYWLAYVEGASSGNPGGPQSFFAPFRRIEAVKAVSRAEAFIQAYKGLSAGGMDVTVLVGEGGTPLGFTAEEMEIISNSNVPLNSGFPRNGVQIEELVRVEFSPEDERSEVRLPQLPCVVLSSSETEIHGRWVIFYTWEVNDWWTLCYPVGEEEVSGLVSQAREAATRGAIDFDLEDARRRAADSIVASKFLSARDKEVATAIRNAAIVAEV